MIQNYKTTPSDLINDINNHLNITSNSNITNSSTILNDINKNYNNTQQIINNDNNNIFNLKKTTKSNNLLSNDFIKDSSNLINQHYTTNNSNNINADIAFSSGSINAMDVNSGPSSIVSNNCLTGFNPTNQNYNKEVNFNIKTASQNSILMQSNVSSDNRFPKKYNENGLLVFILFC